MTSKAPQPSPAHLDLSCEAPPVPTPVVQALHKATGSGGGLHKRHSIFKKVHHHGHGQHHLNPDYVPMRLPEGKVVGVWGAAVLRDAHGKVHPIHCGDDVEKGDVILTAQNGIVEIHGGQGLPNAFPLALAPAGELEFDAPGAGLDGGGSGGLLEGLRVTRVIEIVSTQEYAYTGSNLGNPTLDWGNPVNNGLTDTAAPPTSDGNGGGGSDQPGGNNGGSDGGSHSPTQATVAITGPSHAAETDGHATYTVSLSQPATTDVTVNIHYTGTAADGSDYTAVKTVTIPAGATSVAFDLPILNDAIAEGAETVTLTLDTPTGGSFDSLTVDTAHGTVTTTIDDESNPSAVHVALTGPATVTEGDVAHGYTVTLTEPATTDVTVKLTYTGTAADGTDFTGVHEVVIKAGQTSATFDIATIDDKLAEGSENFTVSVGEITGGGFEAVAADPDHSSVVTTIVDDTPNDGDTVHCSITGPGSVTEGEVAHGYTVTLTEPAATDVTVKLTYTGTAADGTDFTGVHEVVIKAGQSSATFDIATIDDKLAEGSENFTVSIGEVTGGGFEAVAADPDHSTVTTTIVDDTPNNGDTVHCSITGPGSVTEGEVAHGYTVTLTEPAATDVTVKLTYTGTAADGTDFTGVHEVVIKAGQTSATFDIATIDDKLAEGSENFTVSIGEITGGGFEAVAADPDHSSVVTTIVDDTPNDGDTVHCSITGPGSVTEGEVAHGYTVTLTEPATTDVTVKLTYTGTAADGTDFTGVHEVVIKAGQSSATFDIATIDDKLAEGSENFTVSIGEITGGGFEAVAADPAQSSVTTTIVDDTPNDGDTVHCSITGPGSVTEGEVAHGYTVTLTEPATTDITVKLTYTGTAADGTDFTGVHEVVIKAGQSSATFDIATIDDKLAEGSENFTVSIGKITGGGFEAVAADPAQSSITTTIVDDTPNDGDTVHCSITGPGSVTEGEVAHGYTVTLTEPATTDVTVKLTYTGTAADGTDFTGVHEVVIKAGQSSATFDIATIDDKLAEGSENFTVSIGEITGGGFEAVAADPALSSITTTIVDDTPNCGDTVHCSITGPGSVTEGEVAHGYTVTLTEPAATDVTVKLTYTGTATDGSDFTGVHEVVIKAGQFSSTFDIATIDDKLAEGCEHFTVAIGDLTGGGFESLMVDPSASSVQTWIAEHNSTDPVMVGLAGPESVVEGSVASGYTVTLTQPAVSDVTIKLSYSGTAADGSDFTGVHEVTIAAGQSAATFSIQTLDDNLAESGESFTVTISEAVGGGFEAPVATDSAHEAVTTSIVDDVSGVTPTNPGFGTPGPEDTVLIGVCGPGQAMEGVTASGYHVGLSQPAVTDLTVTLTWGGTATDGSDYTHSATVTIPAGQRCAEFSLDILGDSVVEGSETVVIGIGNTSGGGFEALALCPDHTSVTTEIVDTTPIDPGTPPVAEPVVVSLTGPESVTEGDTAHGYTVHLSQPAASDTTVQLTYSGTAEDGSDYTGVTSVTVKAGESSATFDVATLDDNRAEGTEQFTVSLGTIGTADGSTVTVDAAHSAVTTAIVDDVSGVTPTTPGTGTPDAADTVLIGVCGPGQAMEGVTASGYHVGLSQPAVTDLTVTLTWGGTATDGSDYTHSATVTIPAGQRCAEFSLDILGDSVVEGSETVVIGIGNTSGGGFEALALCPDHTSVTTEIVDTTPVDPGTPGGTEPVVISLTGPDSVIEGDTAHGYTVHLSQPATADTTVQLVFSGTATDGTDFTSVHSVTIAAGATQASFDLPTKVDNAVEGPEALTVTLSSATSAGTDIVTIDTAADRVTTQIVDDTAPTVGGQTAIDLTLQTSTEAHEGSGCHPGGESGSSPSGAGTGSVQGQLTITDDHTSVCTITLTAPTLTLTSQGQAIVWTGEGTAALTGHIGNATGPTAVSINVDADGTYQVAIQSQLDGTGSTGTSLTLAVGVHVSDGTHTTDSALDITVTGQGEPQTHHRCGDDRGEHESTSGTSHHEGSHHGADWVPDLVGQVGTGAGSGHGHGGSTVTWTHQGCSHGTFVGEADGSYMFALHPHARAELGNSGQSSSHEFTYECRDSHGSVQTGSVTLIVGCHQGGSEVHVVQAGSLQALAPDTMGLAAGHYGYHGSGASHEASAAHGSSASDGHGSSDEHHTSNGHAASQDSADAGTHHVVLGTVAEPAGVDASTGSPPHTQAPTTASHDSGCENRSTSHAGAGSGSHSRSYDTGLIHLSLSDDDAHSSNHGGTSHGTHSAHGHEDLLDTLQLRDLLSLDDGLGANFHALSGHTSGSHATGETSHTGGTCDSSTASRTSSTESAGGCADAGSTSHHLSDFALHAEDQVQAAVRDMAQKSQQTSEHHC